MSARRAVARRVDTSLVRREEWNGVKKGDHVVVDGVKGDFFFDAHCRRGNIEWIDCHGGPAGHNAVRAFPLHRVKPLGAASLGTRVRVAREARGWSRATLSQKTGLKVSAIGRVESKGYGSAQEEEVLRQIFGLGTVAADDKTEGRDDG